VPFASGWAVAVAVAVLVAVAVGVARDGVAILSSLDDVLQGIAERGDVTSRCCWWRWSAVPLPLAQSAPASFPLNEHVRVLGGADGVEARSITGRTLRYAGDRIVGRPPALLHPTLPEKRP